MPGGTYDRSGERGPGRQEPRRRPRPPHPVRVARPHRRARATSSGWSAPTARARPRCCGSSPATSSRSTGSVSTAPARRLRRLAARRSTSASPARPSAHYVARRTGAAAATAAMEQAAAALGAGDHARAAEDAYAHSLDHWLASGAPDLDDRLAADAGRPRPRRRPGRADDVAVRRAGGPGRAGRPAAEPLRRRAARRAHQRPRPRRAGTPGGVRARRCGPGWCWSRTTASSSRGW